MTKIELIQFQFLGQLITHCSLHFHIYKGLRENMNLLLMMIGHQLDYRKRMSQKMTLVQNLEGLMLQRVRQENLYSLLQDLKDLLLVHRNRIELLSGITQYPNNSWSKM